MPRPTLAGLRSGMTYRLSGAAISGTFVSIDPAQAAVPVNNHCGFVITATDDTNFFNGVVGVLTSGVIHGRLGTVASPYQIGDDVNVVKRGIVHCLYDTSFGVQAPVRDQLVCIGANGRVKPYTPAITANVSTMGDTEVGAIIAAAAATIGNTDVGAIVAARIADATATLTADHPTGAEIKAYLDELFEDVMEEVATAEAVKTKAFLEEVIEDVIAAEGAKNSAYIAEYASNFATDRARVIGRVVGTPDATSTTVAVELFNLPSHQEQ